MKWTTRAWLSCAVLACSMGVANAIPILTVTPATSSVTEGSTARLDVFVTGLYDELIGAYDLTLAFSATQLSLTNVTFDTFLDGPVDSIAGFDIPFAGQLSVFEVSLSGLSNQLGLSQFRLFSLDFLALEEGIAYVALVGGILSNEFGEEYQDWRRQAARLEITAAPPPPTSVPEPETLGLLMAALAGVLVVRRRAAQSN